MLFQQFYNWFQYKTLPPSFFAKNRLLIEREGKRNRIFNKVGSTFRNSKWANYERNNLNFRFVIQIKNILIGLFLSWCLVYFHAQLFNSSFSFFAATTLNYVFWLTMDCCDYCLLFVTWVVLSTLVIVKRVIFFIFFRDLSVSEMFLNELNLNRTTSSNSPVSSLFERSYFHSKVESKLKLKQFEVDLQPSVAKILTQSSSYRNEGKETIFPLLHYNFQIQFLISRLEGVSNIEYLGKILSPTFSSQWNSQNSLNETNQYLAIVLFAFLKQRTSNPFVFVQHSYLKKLQNSDSSSGFVVSLNNILNSPLVNRDLLSTFDEKFDINTSFGEFPTISVQNSVIDGQKRVSRWLYTYSLLHRKTLSDLRRISQIKELLNDNFILTANSQRNLWTSEILNSNVLKSQLRTLYKTFVCTNLNLNTNRRLLTSQTQSPLFHTNEVFIQQICDLETSLSFSIKRFFFFGNLNWDSWCNQFVPFSIQDETDTSKNEFQLRLREETLDTSPQSVISHIDDFRFELNLPSPSSPLIGNFSNMIVSPISKSVSNLIAPSLESVLWRKQRQFWMIIANDEHVRMRRVNTTWTDSGEGDCIFFDK